MATTQLGFTIYLSDPDLVAQYQAANPQGIIRGPQPASAEFSAPIVDPGLPQVVPATRSEWFGNPDFPIDRAYFTINKGFFNRLFGRSKKFVWVGTFQYQAAEDQPVGEDQDPPGPMSEVAFFDGFELPSTTSTLNSGEGAGDGFGNGDTTYTRDASRHIDGLGFGMRQQTGSVTLGHAWNANSPTHFDSGASWERFYIRLRRAPTSETEFWDCRLEGTGISTGFLRMSINSSGALALVTVGGTGNPRTLVGTYPLSLGRWYRLDLVQSNYSDGPVNTRRWRVNCVLKINGEAAITGEGVLVSSITEGDHPRNVGPDLSRMGVMNTGFDAIDLDLDIDDWSGYALEAPATAGELVFPTGIDFSQGTRMTLVRATSEDATHNPLWVGDFRGLSLREPTFAEVIMVSSTSAALLAVLTDAATKMALPGVLGMINFVVSLAWLRATAGDGELGYDLNEEGAEMVTAPGTTVNTWVRSFYRPLALAAPIQVESLMLRFTHPANTNAASVYALSCVMMLVGTFGEEDFDPEVQADDTDALAGAREIGLHNAPFPSSPWVTSADVPPDAPVYVKGGTFVGNETGQDIVSEVPPHFVWCRQIGQAGGGAKWWSSMINGKWELGGEQRSGIPDVLMDPEYVPADPTVDPPIRSLIRIAGGDVAANNNGTTYQYVLFADPGSRFLLCDAKRMGPSEAERVVTLVDDGFTPQFGLFSIESYTDTSNTLFGKGTGHVDGAGSALNAAEGTTVAEFGAGGVNLLVSLATANMPQVAMALWRMSDGIDYDAFEAEEAIPVQIFNYTGDAAASRSLQFPRVTGRRPMWALVIPHGGASYVRDPSHTTNTSSLASQPSATVTTGITAGAIDGMTVGSTLNGSGVVHSVFVIMGLSDAGNGGWSTNGEVYYEELPPPGSQFGDGFSQDEIDDAENPDTGGGLDSFDDGPDLSDDLADVLCVPYVLRAVNLALSRLGISQLFTLATDISNATTREGTMVATFYEHCLRATLRDFPWNHATRYAQLVLVDGSEDEPVNGDWIYKFRMPTGYLFARRLVPGETDGRKYDAAPIPFDIAEDDTGPYLFTNIVREPESASDDVFVELEYTVRPNCGTRAGGDQLFVSTFANRLAMEIGPPLSRDAKLVERCERNYELARNGATTSNVRETQQEKPGDPDWITGR